jgi:hypothetical protein
MYCIETDHLLILLLSVIYICIHMCVCVFTTRESEVHELTLKIALLNEKRERDVEEVRRECNEDIETIEKRVRSTLAKKEEQIASLKDALQQCQVQLKHTEVVLENQRMELLG